MNSEKNETCATMLTTGFVGFESPRKKSKSNRLEMPGQKDAHMNGDGEKKMIL